MLSAPPPWRVPRPIPRRLPRRKPVMTIAAGYVCPDGLVLCADTEMTANVRHSGKKAWLMDSGGAAIAIVGAGDAVLIRLIRNRLFERIRASTTLRKAETIIEQTLKSIFEDHIDRDPSNELDVSVIVGVRRGTTCKLFEHSRTAVADVERFTATGSGAPVADYLSEVLLAPDVKVASAVTLASYVLQQCKKFAPYCGGESHVIIMPIRAAAAFVSASRIERSERIVNDAFAQFAPRARAGFVEVVMGGGGIGVTGLAVTPVIAPVTPQRSRPVEPLVKKSTRRSPRRGR
jgi:20S proteasome alpha/beta subunit